MGILKSLQKLLKIKPNIENLKEKRDVDGLIEAFSYESGDSQVDLKFKGEIAIILGELGDIRAIPTIETALSDLNSSENFWKDIRQNMPAALDSENVREQRKKAMETISLFRPPVTQALQTLRLPKQRNAITTEKKQIGIFTRDNSTRLPWDFQTELGAFDSGKAERQIGRYEVITFETEYQPQRDLPRRVVGTAWAPQAEIHIFVRNVLCKLDPGISVTDVYGGVYMQFVLDFDAGYIEIRRLKKDKSVFRFGQEFPNRIRQAMQASRTVAVVVDFTNPNMPVVVEN